MTDVAEVIDDVDAVAEDAYSDDESESTFIEDGGPRTEPIPVVALLSDEELEDAGVVVLDDEPSALFGTDLGADADVTEIDESAIAEPSADNEAEPQAASASFTTRFASALDELPITRKG